MYKNVLKKLEKIYDDLIHVQYLVVSHENYVENNPKGKDVKYSMERIDELRTREKNKIKMIKKHIQILERISDDLEV